MPPLLSRRLSPPAGAALSLFALVAPLSRSCDLNVTGQEKPRRRRPPPRRRHRPRRQQQQQEQQQQRGAEAAAGTVRPGRRALPPPHAPPRPHRRQVSAHRHRVPGPTCRPRPGLREGAGRGGSRRSSQTVPAAAVATKAANDSRPGAPGEGRRRARTRGAPGRGGRGGRRGGGDPWGGGGDCAWRRGSGRLTKPSRQPGGGESRPLHPGLRERGRGRKPRGRAQGEGALRVPVPVAGPCCLPRPRASEAGGGRRAVPRRSPSSRARQVRTPP